MAYSCRSKVEFHLISYVGAVIQKLPRHLSASDTLQPLFSEAWPYGRGRQGRHENRYRERKVSEEINVKLGLPFHLALGERGGWIAGRMRSGGTGGHLRSIKNQ